MSATITKLDDGNTRIAIPIEFRYDNGRKRLYFPDAPEPELEVNAPLITGIARGYRWQQLLDTGEYSTAEELAKALGVHDSYVRRHLRYAQLAPSIIEAILNGNAPWTLSLSKLEKQLPWSWADQLRTLGMT